MMCGRPTKDGTPCKHQVRYPGGPCAAMRLHQKVAQERHNAKDCLLAGGVHTGRVFEKRKLARNKFNYAILDEAVFIGCDLSGATFVGASLNGTIFKDCILDGVDWGEAGPPIDCIFVDCSPY